MNIAGQWLPTDALTETSQLGGFDGIWVVPGAPYRNQSGVYLAVRYAREERVPFLGTCGGFFSALLEYAANVLELLPPTTDIRHNEELIKPLMVPLTCSVTPTQTPLRLRPGSKLAAIYGNSSDVEEVLQCAYGLASEFMDNTARQGLRYSAWDTDNAPRALEIAGHPFFLGMLYQPELSSAPDSVHPVLAAFLDAARENGSRTRSSQETETQPAEM